MANSVTIPSNDISGCESDLGAYFLPKHYLSVKVIGDRRNLKRDAYKLTLADKHEGTLIAKPDRLHAFCLDFLSSPKSSDLIKVGTTNGLLDIVTTTQRAYEFEDDTDVPGSILKDADPAEKPLQTEDASVDIAKKIEKAQTDFATGVKRLADHTPKASSFTPGESDNQSPEDVQQRKFVCDDGAPETAFRVGNPFVPFCDPPDMRTVEGINNRQVLPLELGDPDTFDASGNEAGKQNVEGENIAFSALFDPADPVDLAVTNEGLKEYGYCLILDGGPIRTRDRQRYCEDPTGFVDGNKDGHRMASGSKDDPEFGNYVDYRKGIIYRPLQSWNLNTYKKQNRKVPGGWLLHERKTVKLANLSPMIAVGVSRTFFSSRNTRIEFEGGVLTKVAIDKKAQLVGAIEVPLKLVRTVARIPAAVVQLRINSTSKLEALAAKQEELIKADRDYIKALDDYQRVKGLSTSANSRSTVQATGSSPEFSQCLVRCLPINGSVACNKQCSCEVNSCPAGQTDCQSFCAQQFN